MTIVVTGGGSGGHITPLLAVAAELKKQHTDVSIVYVGQSGDKFAQVVSESKYVDDTKLIFAGKFRRYHGEGWRQLFDIKTLLLNIRDVFLILLGCIQSVWLMWRIRPAVVFIKGGFVGVPVGLAAAFWRVPYITHDSDALAGLANRIISRWARKHAVALPEEVYEYPRDKTITVGVPIASEYQFVNQEQQQFYKKALDIQKNEQLLFVTGGGLGAQSINDAVAAIVPTLLRQYPTLHIIQTTGHAHRDAVQKNYEALGQKVSKRVIVKDYVTDMYVYSGAADVVVARAGATNMAELAAQGKASIVVPNPILAGGHQVKNAQVFAAARAVEVVTQAELERDSTNLYHAIVSLLDSSQKRLELGGQLHTFARPDAARKLAVILLEQAEPNK